MTRYAVLFCCLSAILIGCSAGRPSSVPEGRSYVLVEKPAVVPPGVARYCWEEPIVHYEANRPGLDMEGHWYSPSYLAVREVRMGRWRPCAAKPQVD